MRGLLIIRRVRWFFDAGSSIADFPKADDTIPCPDALIETSDKFALAVVVMLPVLPVPKVKGCVPRFCSVVNGEMIGLAFSSVGRNGVAEILNGEFAVVWASRTASVGAVTPLLAGTDAADATWTGLLKKSSTNFCR